MSDDELAAAHREAISGTVRVKPDDEFNGEEFWETLTYLSPRIAQQLRDKGEAELPIDVWERMQRLDGFSNGPSHAPYALIVVD